MRSEFGSVFCSLSYHDSAIHLTGGDRDYSPDTAFDSADASRQPTARMVHETPSMALVARVFLAFLRAHA